MSSGRWNLLRIGMCCVVVLGLLVISGCGGDKGTNGGNGSLSGTVFKANSPYPVSGVYVSCAGASATTDINGGYVLEGLPLGSQTLSATKDDYEYFSTTVNITGAVTQDIFIVSSKGGGGNVGEG